MREYFIIMLIPMLITFIFSFCFYSDNDAKERLFNRESSSLGNIRHTPFWLQMKSLFSDVSYIGMFTSSGMISAILKVMGDTLSTMVSHFSFPLVIKISKFKG